MALDSGDSQKNSLLVLFHELNINDISASNLRKGQHGSKIY